MSIRLLQLAVIALVSTGGPATGMEVKAGADIIEVRQAMLEAGYNITGLAMRTFKEGQQLEFWSVGEGVLIANYFSESKRLVGLSFWLADERPKSTRKTFSMSVESFETETGMMTLQAGQPKRERSVAKKPASRPDLELQKLARKIDVLQAEFLTRKIEILEVDLKQQGALVVEKEDALRTVSSRDQEGESRGNETDKVRREVYIEHGKLSLLKMELEESVIELSVLQERIQASDHQDEELKADVPDENSINPIE